MCGQFILPNYGYCHWLLQLKMRCKNVEIAGIETQHPGDSF
jgi:hypothetical protein